MDAPWQIILNPGHDLISTEIEIWGSRIEVEDPPMNGFIWELHNGSDWDMYPRVMMAYNATTVPAISTLAMEFTLFDHWFASFLLISFQGMRAVLVTRSQTACMLLAAPVMERRLILWEI